MDEFDEDGRPLTFVDCLRNLISWLDLTDPIVSAVFPEVANGRGVQEDLERVVQGCLRNPMIDDVMMDMMRNG